MAAGRAAKPPAMRPTGEKVVEVLDRARGPRRAEVDDLLALFGEISGEPPVVWASRIIGFGEVTYRYASGHGGTMPVSAFAPTATKHTIYLPTGFTELWPSLLAKLGPHTASAACLYLTRLSAVDRGVLRELIELGHEHTLAEWG